MVSGLNEAQVLYVSVQKEVQWLRLRASNAGEAGPVPDQGTRIPHAMRCGKKKKKFSAEGIQ